MSSLHWYKQHKIWHKTNKNKTWQTCKCQPRFVQSIGNLVWGVHCKTPAFKSVLHLRVFLWFTIFMFQYIHCLCTPREFLVPVRGGRFPKSCSGIHNSCWPCRVFRCCKELLHRTSFKGQCHGRGSSQALLFLMSFWMFNTVIPRLKISKLMAELVGPHALGEAKIFSQNL